MRGFKRVATFEELLAAARKEDAAPGLISISLQNHASRIIGSPEFQRIQGRLEDEQANLQLRHNEEKVFQNNIHSLAVEARIPKADLDYLINNMQQPPPAPQAPAPGYDFGPDRERLLAELDKRRMEDAAALKAAQLAQMAKLDMLSSRSQTPIQNIVNQYYPPAPPAPPAAPILIQPNVTNITNQAAKEGHSVHHIFLRQNPREEMASSSGSQPPPPPPGAGRVARIPIGPTGPYAPLSQVTPAIAPGGPPPPPAPAEQIPKERVPKEKGSKQKGFKDKVPKVINMALKVKKPQEKNEEKPPPGPPPPPPGGAMANMTKPAPKTIHLRLKRKKEPEQPAERIDDYANERARVVENARAAKQPKKGGKPGWAPTDDNPAPYQGAGRTLGRSATEKKMFRGVAHRLPPDLVDAAKKRLSEIGAAAQAQSSTAVRASRGLKRAQPEPLARRSILRKAEGLTSRKRRRIAERGPAGQQEFDIGF